MLGTTVSFELLLLTVVTSLAGNNVLAHYEQSSGYDQISLSNIHGLYGYSCKLLDVIFVYSLVSYFSYEQPKC